MTAITLTEKATNLTYMNYLLTIIAALLCTGMASAATKTVTVTVTNPSAFGRKAVPVVMEVDDDVRSASVRLDGKEIPCQLDDLDDDGEFDELAFLTDMQSKERQVFSVELSTTGQPRAVQSMYRIRSASPETPVWCSAAMFSRTAHKPFCAVFM